MRKIYILILEVSIFISLLSIDSKEKSDIIAGTTLFPENNQKILEESKIISKHFMITNTKSKFMGYDSKHIINANSYYLMRINRCGQDNKWFTKDDQIDKYYLCIHCCDLIISKLKYVRKNKKGILQFSQNDECLEREVTIALTDNGLPLEIITYKGNKIIRKKIYKYYRKELLKKIFVFNSKNELIERREYKNLIIDGSKVEREIYFNSKGDKKFHNDLYYNIDGSKKMMIKYDFSGKIYAKDYYDSKKSVFVED